MSEEPKPKRRYAKPGEPKSPKTKPSKSTGKHKRHVPSELSLPERLAERFRLARIAKHNSDEAKTPLSPEEEAFVVLWLTPDANGRSRTQREAFLSAFPGADPKNRTRTARKPNVARRIEEFKAELLAEVMSDATLAQGVANQSARIAARNQRWFALRQVMVERAEFYERMATEGERVDEEILALVEDVRAKVEPLLTMDTANGINVVAKALGKLAEGGDFLSANLTDMAGSVQSIADSYEEVRQVLSTVRYLRDKVQEREFYEVAPGAETGLVVHKDKWTKEGRVREWSVDTATLSAVQSLEDSVAKELGQIAPTKIDATLGVYSGASLMGLNEWKDEDVEARIRELESQKALPSPTSQTETDENWDFEPADCLEG